MKNNFIKVKSRRETYYINTNKIKGIRCSSFKEDFGWYINISYYGEENQNNIYYFNTKEEMENVLVKIEEKSKNITEVLRPEDYVYRITAKEKYGKPIPKLCVGKKEKVLCIEMNALNEIDIDLLATEIPELIETEELVDESLIDLLAKLHSDMFNNKSKNYWIEGRELKKRNGKLWGKLKKT